MATQDSTRNEETLNLSPASALPSGHHSLKAPSPPPLDDARLYTYGQVAPTAVVQGKPTTEAVALEVLRVNSYQANMSREHAELVLQEWREGKLGFLSWLAVTALFGVFYGLFLHRLFLLLAAGVVLTVITCALYFSPWFKSADGVFTVMTFLVGTFVTDYICAFLSIVFGSVHAKKLMVKRVCRFNDATVLGCGALIFVHGTVSMYLFRKHKDAVAASEKLEKEDAHLAMTQLRASPQL